MIAEDFVLPDESGADRSLSDYMGKWVVLYFYPKDDTPGCTKEACSLRDAQGELQALGVQVLGVSKDSVSSHKQFHDKYQLNFPLLSDESKEVIIAYGAWGKKKFLGKEYDGTIRKTYLIDDQGEIRKVYESVNPFDHAAEILRDLKTLKP
ncbi:thiol peroxidase [Candidatus Gottesmanbacteria bacterium RIFCSPLOWO2_01_FULL_46_9]|uniref:thioredoxin-dependent peroxiredoxin n=1 Tax=Candidatus Gottesmanbacteria bacterium RIFCSPLOWO2_01_FULL_46_9 TaxID=1798394 RepID=A0A1F6AX89_9BACT|nr:MAG: thiol peroxidase [Candidatus Gottesmanbacteria bacterium RIFCSPLOWO2_01_FULL_46_9]